MRRILILTAFAAGTLLLAGCGNKGPLVRAPAPAASPAQPAPAASADLPADGDVEP